MDCNTFSALAAFRQELYATFGNGRDALFDACDALLTETQARSFVELSLSPLFVRRWSRLYQAVQNAKIDREALRKAFACSAPAPTPDKRLVLGIDASSIARPQSPTARDRTYVHQSNLPQGSVPTAPGWQFSTLTALPDTPSSWTYILDHIRIQSQQTQGQAAAQQPTALVPQLASRPLLLGDGYYGGVTFLQQIADVPCDALLRLAKNRVLYRPAPPPTAGRGAPRKDGARFQPQDGAHREKMAPASHRRTGRTAKRWRPPPTGGRGAPRKDGARLPPEDGAHREKMAPASHRRTGRTAKRWRPLSTAGRGAPRKDGARFQPQDGAHREKMAPAFNRRTRPPRSHPMRRGAEQIAKGNRLPFLSGAICTLRTLAHNRSMCIGWSVRRHRTANAIRVRVGLFSADKPPWRFRKFPTCTRCVSVRNTATG